MAQVLLAKNPTETQSNNNKKLTPDKAESKNSFFESLGWKNSKKTALICITYPLTEKNNVHFIQQIMPGLLEQDVKLVFMGIGTEKYQNYLMQVSDEQADKVAILEETQNNKDELYAAADILLCPSNTPECQTELREALAHQVVPVALEQNLLENYDAVQERGNAFTFPQASSWSLFATLIRALENFKFPYDWKNIQKAGRGENSQI